MKKTIAAWTLAAATMFSLAACAGAPSSDAGASSENSAESAPAAEENAASGDQSVADACAIVKTKIQDATTAATEIDMSQATNDPQGTVDQFTETVDGVGEAVESVSNADVKTAVSAVHEDFVALRDLLSKVLVDQDMSAAAEITTAATDVQTSAEELGSLCG